MAFGISRVMLIPLMVLNFCLYFIAAALAGSVLNRNFNANSGLVGSNIPFGNVVTPVFTTITLVACMVGLASVLAGMHHMRVWRTDSLAAAGAVSLIAWTLTLLAMGIDAKEIHTRYGRNRRLRTVDSSCRSLSCSSCWRCMLDQPPVRDMPTSPAKKLYTILSQARLSPPLCKRCSGFPFL